MNYAGIIAFVLCLTTPGKHVPVIPRAPLQAQPLAVAPDEVAEQHGLILRAIARGELDAGAGRLEALGANPRASELLSYIERDRDRCRALSELRAKHIAELVAKGKRVTLECRSGKLVGVVSAFAAGRLTLSGGKGSPTDIAADELLLLPLVRSFGPTVLEGVDPAVRGYAFVLTEDSKGIAALKGSPQAEALRAESDSFYKSALELGLACELLDDLAKTGAPTDAAAAKRFTSNLEQLAARFKGLRVVAKRRRALQAAAVPAYELLFDGSKVMDGLSGAVEKLTDGRVRITYDFKKIRKISDFGAEKTYLSDFLLPHKGTTTPLRDMVVDGGVLRLGGDGVWRHKLEFTGSISVTYSFATETIEDPSVFFVGVNDDRAGSFVLSRVDTQLCVRDLPTGLEKISTPPPPRMMSSRKFFTSMLTVANGAAVVIENGKEATRSESGPRTRGGMFIALRGKNDTLFSQIVIEARVDTDGMRKRWAEAKAAELEF